MLRSDTNFLLVEFSASAMEDNKTITATEAVSFVTANRALITYSILKDQGLLYIIAPSRLLQKIHAFRMGDSSIRPNGNIVFKLRSSTEYGAVEKILKGRVNDVRENGYSVFIAEVKQLDDLLKLANELYETDLVEFSHPDFIADIRLTSLD